jgi:hypothetical protein
MQDLPRGFTDFQEKVKHAQLLERLCRETGRKVERPPSAMRQLSMASLRGLPVVGTHNDQARALAGVGPTDPWKRQRERDYATRSGANGTCHLSHDQILAKSGGCCYLCGDELDIQTMQIEHVIPLALGGTHTDENVAAACGSCNARKGARIVSFIVTGRKAVYV